MRSPAELTEGIVGKPQFIMDLQSPDAAWDYLVGQLFHQRSRMFEEVRAAVKAASVPMPAEIVERIAHLGSVDVREVLREHPGYDLWERHQSYQASHQVFARAASDLLKAIEHFSDLARDGALFWHTRQAEADDLEKSIQKELFAAANAAHSLVDLSRRIQKIAKVTGYEDRLRHYFGDDGLHEFVITLRNMLHHLHALQPGYLWQTNFDDTHQSSTSFVLQKLDTARAIAANKQSLTKEQLKGVTKYLGAAPDDIDIASVFEGYRTRAAAFHAWFNESLRAHAFTNVNDYERCMLEHKRFATRTWWNCLLGNWLNNWKTPPNPYNHLDKYLTPAQMDKVMLLPKGSTEQVDKIIAFVDVDGACTEQLRQQAYELFRRAPAD